MHPPRTPLTYSALWATYYDDMHAALSSDPTRLLPTPAWGPRHSQSPAYDIILDHFAGLSGTDALLALLATLRDPSLSPNWLHTQSRAYADTHAPDAYSRLEA